jgi:hypothetical protein
MSTRLSARFQHFFLSLLSVLALAEGARAATLEQETIARLDQIRAIRPGQGAETLATYDRMLDATWQFLNSHKPAVLPILRGQLSAELARNQPNDSILLDVGFFLHENDDSPEGKALARDGLFRLNPRSAVVSENRNELFNFVHAAAEDGDPRSLVLIDREFLSSDDKIFIPQHALNLDATMVCVFLYGAYGPDSEPALSAKLRDPSVSKRVLEILAWLGSPESLKAVGEALSAAPNYETFSRVTAYMMQAGGPAGKEFMLHVSPERLDEKSRQYLTKIKSAVQKTSYEAIRNSFVRIPGDKHLSDAEVKSRLNAMFASFGTDDRTSPMAILDSGLRRSSIQGQLAHLRRSVRIALIRLVVLARRQHF